MEIVCCNRCKRHLEGDLEFMEKYTLFKQLRITPVGIAQVNLCYNCEQDFEKWLATKPEKKEAADNDP